MTYRFYYKDFRWFMAVSFELPAPSRVTKSRHYGCIGIDLNPDSIGWAYVDCQGNLKASGQIALHLSGKRKGQVKAIIGDAVKELTILADTYACPIVCESLDFSRKKAALRERGRKYARMLSNFAYSRFFEALSGRCFNQGIELIQVNPAYTSLIGLVKYARMYGLASDESAGLAIARRGMRLSERLPRAITALLQVNCSRHVWHGYNKLNKKLTEVRRHSYYSISNWEPLVNPNDEEQSRLSGKRQRAKGSAST
jgi:IS605 OrfB family transposase